MPVSIKNNSGYADFAWDKYVNAHPQGTFYHLAGWRNVIHNTYGLKTYYLLAIWSETGEQREPENQLNHESTTGVHQRNAEIIVGVLPLVHLKHVFLGNSLISVPYLDFAGVLADDEKIAEKLISEAICIGEKLGVANIELRQTTPLLWPVVSFFNKSSPCRRNPNKIIPVPKSNSLPSMKRMLLIQTHKVRMLLHIQGVAEVLMKSFKSKLRSQIRKPIKEGLVARLGGDELLDDFYKVFSVTMRDLGSPVHSKNLFKNILKEFSNTTRIVIVYMGKIPLACSIIAGFKDVLANPWASSLREYSRLSPNMLLYWAMLGYAGDNGYKKFDFGRSTPGEGTFKFKEQWGAHAVPLHWHYILFNGRQSGEKTAPNKEQYGKIILYWQKLPVAVTRLLGPMIRKHIGL